MKVFRSTISEQDGPLYMSSITSSGIYSNHTTPLPEQEQQSRDGKFGTSLNGFSTSSALSNGQDKLRRRRTSISR